MRIATIEATFTAEEHGDGTPFLFLRPRGDMPAAFPSHVALKLREGTTAAEAEELERMLSVWVVGVSVSA